MQVKIDKINEKETGEIYIEFSSLYGNSTGLWSGEKPILNKSYYVEVEVPQKLKWGIDIVKIDSSEYRIWNEQETVFINAQIDSVDDDNCLAIRLGDSIVLIETSGIPYAVGDFLEIVVSKIVLYDINY
jgi:hypothetical protein